MIIHSLPSGATPLAYFVRHGETVLNAQNRFRGPENPPLSKTGESDAHQLAVLFEGVPFSGIVSSDKLRSMQTSQIIADAHNAEVHPNAGLHAWNIGDLAGQKKTPATDKIIAYHVAHPDIPMPGGESLNDFRSRVRPLFAAAIEVANKTGKPPIVVAHSSVIHELGKSINGDHVSTIVDPGGVAAVYRLNGKICAKPVYKSRTMSKSADTVS